jgi:hypothetical protein
VMLIRYLTGTGTTGAFNAQLADSSKGYKYPSTYLGTSCLLH